jgi:hypothetical protein
VLELRVPPEEKRASDDALLLPARLPAALPAQEGAAQAVRVPEANGAREARALLRARARDHAPVAKGAAYLAFLPVRERTPAVRFRIFFKKTERGSEKAFLVESAVLSCNVHQFVREEKLHQSLLV